MDLAGLLIRPSPIELFGSKGLRSYIITRVLMVETDSNLKLHCLEVRISPHLGWGVIKILNLVRYNRT